MEVRRALIVACVVLAGGACPKGGVPSDAGVVVVAPVDDAASAPTIEKIAKRIAITPNGVGPMGAGAVTRALVARVFLEGVTGAIEETVETSDGQPVGRAYTVKRGEGVDLAQVAVVHADTDGQLYSVEILAPIADARGVTVGDLLGKALGDEPVKCARGIEERQRNVYCSRKSEPQILFTVTPKSEGQGDGPVPPETLRSLAIDAIVWRAR
jgi:hypothetical protein